MMDTTTANVSHFNLNLDIVTISALLLECWTESEWTGPMPSVFEKKAGVFSQN